MMHGKFAKAKDDLAVIRKTSLLPELTAIAEKMLASAEKFYIPGDHQGLIMGAPIDDYKDVLRLPYDCVAILSPSRIRLANTPQESDIRGLKISLATNVFGPTNKALRFINPSFYREEDRPIIVLSLVSFPHNLNGFWTPYPAAVLVFAPPREAGITVALANVPGSDRLFMQATGLPTTASHQTLIDDMAEDITMTQLLCVLLSLHNVRTKEIRADVKLEKSRRIRGKAPLPPYHVLDVNGDVWDSPKGGGGAGNDGYRSHLRRGHIRRLDETRRVWVSSCFVQGRKEGFADKDYRVVTPTSSPASPHEGACNT